MSPSVAGYIATGAAPVSAALPSSGEKRVTTPDQKPRDERMRSVWGPSGEPGAPEKPRRSSRVAEETEVGAVRPVPRWAEKEFESPEKARRRPSEVQCALTGTTCASSGMSAGSPTAASRRRAQAYEEPVSPIVPRKLVF
eukprot:gb/GFBE01023796.1/.p1 GENE.gb/GFBE01023796.1/~~gb/GFBE01023796.1/.p1  ORF type:complete len:140 (+),score=14.11 gb/GFBE01023796.1/:1-420(+)